MIVDDDPDIRDYLISFCEDSGFRAAAAGDANQAINLLLPPGEEALTVTVRFEDEVALDGTFFIYPQQSSRPTSMEPSGIFSKNESVYARSEAYPSNPLGNYSTHFLNGHSVLLSTFTPVQYVPSTGKVTYYRKATVEVTTRRASRTAAPEVTQPVCPGGIVYWPISTAKP